jgi:leucyl aminopeptidase
MEVLPLMDHDMLVSDGLEDAIPVHAAGADALETALSRLEARERRFAEAQGFKGEAGRHVLVPDADGGIGKVLFGLGGADAPERTPLLFGRLATALPAGSYQLADGVEDRQLAALAFALGGYRFDRYRKPKEGGARLVVKEAELKEIGRIRDGVFFARDLINTPANDLAPRDLAAAAESLASRHSAEVKVVDGDELQRDFPMIHAVGAGSDRPPCLVDMRWGSAADPKVTLIGKGIVFDTGGLDIKPPASMLLMKKDMGGAANVLGLASMIMDAGLKVRLRVLVPAAENAISGRAFRPSDVLRSRMGLTVEIGNTDAEGRLVLADAMALADEESPELMVTMATLTGAARVALGPELPALFCDDSALVGELEAASRDVFDPMWRLPLWRPYDSLLASKVADLNHISPNGFSGAIIAALFLRRFVSAASTFAHFDIYAWSPSARPASPEGGEAQAIRALFRCLFSRYG